MSLSPTPVYVIVGFLGSGKTTLLNHLLHNSQGVSLAVIVNDFGEIPVDERLVAGQVDNIMSLANGCLCCQADDDELEEMLSRLASLPDIEGIVIEASGLAEPRVLRTMVHTATTHSPHLTQGGMITVIDASEITGTLQQHPDIARHIPYSDLLVLNKADRVSPTTLQGVRTMVQDIAPALPLTVTVRGQLDPRLLFSTPTVSSASAPSLAEHRHHRDCHQDHHQDYHHDDCCEDHSCDDHHHCDHHHLHDSYNVVSLRWSAPLHPVRWMNFLRAGAGGSYRLKGFIHVQGPTECEHFLIEKTGQHLELRRWFPQPQEEAGVVCIGMGMDEDALLTAAARCEIGPHEQDSLHDSDIWSLYPYLEDETSEPDAVMWEDDSFSVEENYMIDPSDDPTLLP